MQCFITFIFVTLFDELIRLSYLTSLNIVFSRLIFSSIIIYEPAIIFFSTFLFLTFVYYTRLLKSKVIYQVLIVIISFKAITLFSWLFIFFSKFLNVFIYLLLQKVIIFNDSNFFSLPSVSFTYIFLLICKTLSFKDVFYSFLGTIYPIFRNKAEHFFLYQYKSSRYGLFY